MNNEYSMPLIDLTDSSYNPLRIAQSKRPDRKILPPDSLINDAISQYANTLISSISEI